MPFKVKIDPTKKQKYLATSVRGEGLLLNHFINKGVAFSAEERSKLHLHGLLPPAICTMEQQLERTYENYQANTSNLKKYIYLASLQDRNETLFFRLLQTHIDEMMPVVYTPVVGEACQKFSHIYRRPRGLYISIDDQDRIEAILSSARANDPSVIVATDGERILGLGDQGAGGMGIPIGKLCLYTLCAGIPPYKTLPLMLDVGTNNEALLNDPLYLGLRRRRVTGKPYQDFIDAVVAAVTHVFPQILFQWEDFLKENALFQLERFKDKLCTFNDDIQGTASVVLAGVFGGLRISKQAIKDQRMVLAGAGAAGQGIADLFMTALVDAGLSAEEANARIWMTDRQGLVHQGRANLAGFKKRHARPVSELTLFKAKNPDLITLQEVIEAIKPTILLGISGTPGLFDEEVVRAMAKATDRPMIFPLSNPTSQSECTAEEALVWSEGRAIVATGSPFAPVDFKGKRFRIGQCNNAYIFPGVGLGITVGQVRRVTNGMFYAAAKTMAHTVSSKDLEEGSLFPALPTIRQSSHAVACAVIRQACEEGHANPKILKNLEGIVQEAMWEAEYLPVRYEV